MVDMNTYANCESGGACSIWASQSGSPYVKVGNGECTGKSSSSLSLGGHFEAFGRSGPADITITFTSDSTADVLIKAISTDTQKATMVEQGGKLHYTITTLNNLEVIQSAVEGGWFVAPGVIFEIPSQKDTFVKYAF